MHNTYVSRKTVDTIAKTLDRDDIIDSTHSNKGKSSKHAQTYSDVKKGKYFLLD